jgi:hypothetical protein
MLMLRGTVTFKASKKWVDIGAHYEPYDYLDVRALGFYKVNASDTERTPNDGNLDGPAAGAGYAAPDLPKYVVVYRVGDNPASGVGGEASLASTVDGEVYVTVNDDDFSDNSGEITIQWFIERPGPSLHCGDSGDCAP